MVDEGAITESDLGARNGDDLDAGREAETDVIALDGRDAKRS
jgi:hypothetical protein